MNKYLEKIAFSTVPHDFVRAKYREDSKSSTDWRNMPDPVASVKRDGAAFFLRVLPDGSPQYLSRRESVRGGYPDRTEQLPHLSETKLPEFAGDVYHVELVHTGHTFKDGVPDSHPIVSGILNSGVERAISTQRVLGPVRAVMLDVISPKLGTYKEKLARMHEVSMAYGSPSVLHVVDTKIGRAEIEKLIKDTNSEGHEGVIITSLTAQENSNVRIKVKHVDTYNLRVVGITEEKDLLGNPKGSMGALIVVDGSGRIVANVGTGFSREDRIEIWKNRKDWEGKLIQVKAMPSTSKRLRSPVYNGLADGNMDFIKQ